MHAAEQLFPVDIIRACQHAAATVEFSGPPRAGLYLGVDIGRHRDLTVPWTLEHVDGTYWTREVLELEDTPYAEQQELLLPRIRRARHAAVDATGLGGPIAEDLVTRLGKDKVTAIHFTNERKRELFSALKRHLQAGTVRIPLAARFRDDLASLQRIVTPSGVIKFHAAHTKDGHADRATALALALHAAALHPQKTLPCETAIHYGPQPLRHHRPRRTRFRPAWH
jgi:phage FluMu gp28-like protein